MKLNPDCIRAILLSIEASTDSTRFFSYTKHTSAHEHLLAYTHNEILYHLYQCDMAGLVAGFNSVDDGDLVTIRFLSPKGHELLENIRHQSVWEKTIKVASRVGAGGLGSIEYIAKSIVTELIKHSLGIT